MISEDVKNNLVALIGNGNRLISIGDALINPAYIISIEKAEDYVYVDSSHQIEGASLSQTLEEFELASRRAEEIRKSFAENGIGKMPKAERVDL